MVIYGNEPDIILWKQYLNILANFNVIATQSGEVFYYDNSNLTFLHQLEQSLKGFAAGVYTGKAIDLPPKNLVQRKS